MKIIVCAIFAFVAVQESSFAQSKRQQYLDDVQRHMEQRQPTSRPPVEVSDDELLAEEVREMREEMERYRRMEQQRIRMEQQREYIRQQRQAQQRAIDAGNRYSRRR
jgi:HAMP domain-containing protein